MEYSKFFQIIRQLISWIGDMMNIEFIKGLPLWKIGVIFFFISALFSILQLAMSGTVGALQGDLDSANRQAIKASNERHAKRQADKAEKQRYQTWLKDHQNSGGDS